MLIVQYAQSRAAFAVFNQKFCSGARPRRGGNSNRPGNLSSVTKDGHPKIITRSPKYKGPNFFRTEFQEGNRADVRSDIKKGGTRFLKILLVRFRYNGVWLGYIQGAAIFVGR